MTDPYPPVVPGRPPEEPTPYSPPPQVYYPPQPQPVYYQPPDPNAGIRKAGTIAIWVWILMAVVPAVLIIGGCLACLGLGFVGAATSDPVPTP